MEGLLLISLGFDSSVGPLMKALGLGREGVRLLEQLEAGELLDEIGIGVAAELLAGPGALGLDGFDELRIIRGSLPMRRALLLQIH